MLKANTSKRIGLSLRILTTAIPVIISIFAIYIAFSWIESLLLN